jgi:methyltransferase (TIGR00027 family)
VQLGSKTGKGIHPMNENNQNNPIAAAIFYTLNILLFPVMLIGYLLWSASYLTGRKSGASGTAQAPLIARWYQHHLGTRQDEPADRLLRALTSVPLAIPLGMGTVILAHRVSGYVPKSFRYPFEGEITLGTQSRARQTFYDNVVQQYLPEIAQFVILGAGFDTRALNLPKDKPARAFEIDTPATQAVKRQTLTKAGIDSSGVTFVSADFETEDWLAKLIEAGFDRSKSTLFIWEGVTPYLDREAVEDTLRKIASLAKGSIVAFDYFTTEVLESKALAMRAIRASLSASGEPLKFGIDSTPPTRERLVEFLRSCGLELAEQLTLGEETAGERAWGGAAIAIVK